MTAADPPAPVWLPPNPVWRSYAGGRVLRRFRAPTADSVDDHFPEDWLASTVRARNHVNAQGPDEGLSRLFTQPPQTLADAIQARPQFWFGARSPMRTTTGVLWKLLDASVRLQFQAHPDRRFARAHLRSAVGKTECWYILGTRGEACVYLGFQRPPGKAGWAEMIREQQVDRMLGCFDPIPVQAGECYVVPAGTPHAIGAGVFMVELMEPTDWVVRCERVNAGVTLPPEACFMGLDLETCLEVFDYRGYSPAEARNRFQQQPRLLRQDQHMVEEEIIGPAWHEFFRLHRLRGEGRAEWAGDELMLLIALKGQGTLSAGGEAGAVQAGQTWLLPGAAAWWQWQPRPAEQAEGSGWELLLAKLPVISAMS